MISKNDCILLLTDLQDKGENVDNYINKLFISTNIPEDVIEFINKKRLFEVANFYEKLRWSYNHKHSNLYKNLVREEFDKPEDVLTTLSSLNLQIFLYLKTLETNKQLFLKHSRAEEITKVLNQYLKDYDLRPALKLLYLIKSDLKTFESIKNK